MAGLVAGIGVRAVAGAALRKGAAIAEAVPWQVWIALLLTGFMAFLAISRGDWMDRAHGDEARYAEICQVVRIADHNPKLDCAKVGAQIELMGQALTETTAALNKQTAEIKALAANSARQQRLATQARKQAEQRAEDAEAVSQRLDASSRALRRSPGPVCEPSKTLQEQWP